MRLLAFDVARSFDQLRFQVASARSMQDSIEVIISNLSPRISGLINTTPQDGAISLD